MEIDIKIKEENEIQLIKKNNENHLKIIDSNFSYKIFLSILLKYNEFKNKKARYDSGQNRHEEII